MRSFLVIALLCIASIAYGQQKETPRIEPKPETKNAVAAERNPNETSFFANLAAKVKEDERHDKASEISIFGIRIGEAALVFATIMLWLATRDLVLEGRDASRKQLRAYLAATPQDIRFLGGDWIQTYIDIENTGSTPARNVRHWTDWQIRVPTNNTDFALPKESGHGNRPIAPRGKWTLGFEMQLTPQQLAGLQTKMTEIFVWGRIEYADVFGNNQWLTFRFRNIGTVFTQDRQGNRVPIGWSLFPEGSGNEAS